MNMSVMPGRACPICHNTHNKKIGDLLPTDNICDRSFALVHCMKCDLIYLSPAPTPAELRVMYEESNQFTSDEYYNPIKVRSALEYYSGCCRKLISLLKRNEQPLSLVEFGAGLSWMARALKQLQHPSPIVTVAQDVSPEVRTRCSWVDHYIVGAIDDKRILTHGPYHIASMTHVIEHLVDPVMALRKITKILVKNGCILITAPHRPENWISATSPLSSWAAWSYNHVPGHLQYFSRRALGRAAKAAGLELVAWDLHENGQAFEAILRRTAYMTKLSRHMRKLPHMPRRVAARFFPASKKASV